MSAMSDPRMAGRRSKGDFRFRDTRLCFTLPATLGDRGSAHPYERLGGPDDLARWCRESGILDSAPLVDEVKFEKALQLREAIQRVGEAIATGRRPKPGDIACINVAAVTDVVPQLSEDGTSLRWVATGVEAALARIARDAVDLFSGPFRERIRICANARCAGLFVDESRPGQRRWCSMSTCGDQAKKARYRSKPVTSRESS
jgi:predicted RNA-binding Zn ribbon-like protein